MDRDLSPKFEPAQTTRKELPDLDLLPSQRACRDAIRAALLERQGLVVLTGDPGVGKTALIRSLEAEHSLEARWIKIEIMPSIDVSRFYRVIRHGFGLGPGTFDRTELDEFLAERSLDGDRWILAIDEAQNLNDELLEEIRVLSNRLGDSDGFAAIILVGQTRLAHRLRRRTSGGLAARVADHLHLRSLDADEVGHLLRAFNPSYDWSNPLVERIHVMSEGRPARAVTLASRIVAKASVLTPAVSSGATELPSSPSTDTRQPEPVPSRLILGEQPLVGPARPPIRVSEGLIEVGWQAETEDEEDVDGGRQGNAENPFDRSNGGSVEGEERIIDRYAALQAWQEWATNHARQPDLPKMVDTQGADEPVLGAGVPDDSPLAANPRVWADDEHGTPPFSHLFSRVKHENEAK